MTYDSVLPNRATVRTLSAALATAVAGAAIAIPLISSPTASASVYQSPGLSSGKTLSGVVIPGGASAAKSFASWRKAPVTTIVAYSGTDSWNSFTNIAGEGLTGYWNGIAAHHVWSVPLIPSDGSSTISQAAAGAYDSKYATFARGLVAGGDSRATIRLGWEMTGDWFAWSGVKNPAAFAAGFRHAVTAMRSVQGQHFTFDFSVATDHLDPGPFYPGDAYVDIVGGDQYDVAWNVPATNHAAAWAFDLTAPGGLNWMANFAAAHHKRISLPEWGLAYRCDGHGGGDDPYFIDKMRSWIDSHDVAYEAYFESDDNSCTRFKLTSGIFPNGANEYIKKWSTASNTVTNPIPPGKTPAPKPAAAPKTGLLVSSSATRSNPRALSKSRLVKGSAYIFYRSASAVRQVTFSLDGRAYHTETAAAYDMVGTSGKYAKPFAVKSLKRGTHTIKATVELATGKWTSSKATFKVGPAPKSLSTRLLRVSSAPSGKPTVSLNLAVVGGTKYLIFPRVTNKAKANYWLDGKLIRSGKVNPKGIILVKPYRMSGLRAGMHTVVLHLVSWPGHLTVVKARFRVV